MSNLSDEQLRFHILEIVAKYSKASSPAIWCELSEKIISFIKTGKHPTSDPKSALSSHNSSEIDRAMNETSRHA